MEKKVILFPKADETAPEFIMQDLETGDVEPADDLGKMLFGNSVNKDELKLVEIHQEDQK